MPGAVWQLVSGFAAGDAISQESIAIRDLCRELGRPADIFAPPDRVAPDAAHQVRPLAECAPAATDTVICHYSIQSPATAVFQRCTARKVLLYHNITPAAFFRPFDTAVARQLEDARAALPALAREADAVWADSAFNAGELEALGIPDVRVFPLVFAPAAWDLPPDPVVRQGMSGPETKLLFVGRLAPNKAVEDLIRAFAWYHTALNRRSRLMIVGSDRSCPTYFAMLRMLAGELDLDRVVFVRYASPAGLTAYYAGAHLFVSASRHEGYCLPLVEAMYKGLPVIARRTGGVPEAMDGAGVLVDDDATPETLALLWQRVLTDTALREEILNGQRARVQRALARPLRTELQALLDAG